MRAGESEQVEETFRRQFQVDLVHRERRPTASSRCSTT